MSKTKSIRRSSQYLLGLVLWLAMLATTSVSFGEEQPAQKKTRLEQQNTELEAQKKALEAKVATDQANVQAAQQRLDAATVEAEQAQSDYEITRAWISPDAAKTVLNLIREGSKHSPVPRKLRSIYVNGPDGETPELLSRARTGLIVGVYAVKDPSLPRIAKALYEEHEKYREAYGFGVMLVLLGATDAELQAKANELQTNVPLFAAPVKALAVAYEQTPVVSGTFMAIGADGEVRYQGPLPFDQAPRLFAKEIQTRLARVKELQARIASGGGVNLGQSCFDAYKKHGLAMQQENPLMYSFDEAETRAWCRCLDINLRNVLTGEERADFAMDPIGFIDKADSAKSVDGRPVWRLATPIGGCRQ